MKYEEKEKLKKEIMESIEEIIRQSINYRLIDFKDEIISKIKKEQEKIAEEEKNNKVKSLSNEIEEYILARIDEKDRDNSKIDHINFTEYFMFHLFFKLNEIDYDLYRVSVNTRL